MKKMSETEMNQEQIYQDLLELCAVPSVSQTDGERNMVNKIHDMLARIPYFQNNPEQVQICPVEDDPYHRNYVCALLQGGKKDSRTVVLLSHFDVVGVEEFGMQKELAFYPEEFTQYLKEHPEIQLPEDARRDLESGDYLFGRGTMDMKFGIAADLEILREFAKVRETMEGNLLFLSVPDEEANSAGMRAAVKKLLSLGEEKQLQYTCCLISEPHFPKFAGDGSKYIYTGTIGKLLPAFCCFGQETHACEPFSGLNPNLLTAKLIEKIDCNPEFSDSSGGVFTPPPICLKQADTKTEYSVQTPAAAYTYFNYMTLSQTPGQVMEEMLETAKVAFAEVLCDLQKKAERSTRITGDNITLPPIEPKVISFGELYDWCSSVHGEKFQEHMKALFSQTAGESVDDFRELSVEAVRQARSFCPYRGPMIVFFYAPPFYPHSEPAPADGIAARVCRFVADCAQKMFGEELKTESFFPGLSDMSYLGLSDRIDMKGLTKNFPVWGSTYSIPLEEMAKLQIPFFNVGPLGKDAHKFTERLCLSYSFQKAAPLLRFAVSYLLKQNEDESAS